MRWAFIGALLFLAACASDPLYRACQTFDGIVDEATIMKASGQLTSEQIATLDEVFPLGEAACTGTITDRQASLRQVREAIDKARLEMARKQ